MKLCRARGDDGCAVLWRLCFRYLRFLAWRIERYRSYLRLMPMALVGRPGSKCRRGVSRKSVPPRMRVRASVGVSALLIDGRYASCGVGGRPLFQWSVRGCDLHTTLN